MTKSLNRRQFFQQSSSIGLGGIILGTGLLKSPAALASNANGPLKKAACIGVLPKDLSLLERFKLAKSAGFESIEPNTLETPEEVKQYKEASRATGVGIHSIMNSGHWKYPLTDNDPEVVQQCIEGIKTSLRNAHELGADTVLLVPGIVTADVRYGEVYERSQNQIRKLLPLAKELNVVIAIENVGNRFLLSPLEFARYVDEFENPYVRAYFDIGNVTSIGFPQDWIRTLDKRLIKIHIKKFQPGDETPAFNPKDRRTRGIDWLDVRKALSDVGYAGWVTAEVRSGDEAYVKEVSARMDRFFEGENPVGA